MTTPAYALSNAAPGAAAMHECLSGILDEYTADLLVDYVVISSGDRLPADSRTLVLGAGNGSIALWLAKEVTLGTIVVLDKDTSLVLPEVRNHPRIEVVTCDLDADYPFPSGPWHLITGRLLFAHLPQRRRLLIKAVDELVPGGVLLVEDWGVAGPGRVLDAASDRTGRLYQRYQEALIKVFAAAGNDPYWCLQVNAEMAAAGLVDVQTHTRARSWTGGTPGCQLPIAVSTELQPKLVEHGITIEELDELREDLADPQTVLLGNLTWSTLGRRALQAEG